MDEVTYLVELLRDNWPSSSVMQNTLGIPSAHRVKPTILDIRNLSSGASTDGTAGKVSRGQARQYSLLNQTSPAIGAATSSDLISLVISTFLSKIIFWLFLVNSNSTRFLIISTILM